MSDKVNQEALETIEWLETKYRESLDEIKRLRAALRSWQRSNEAMEWLDDDSPLVRQTREALGDE